MQPECRHGRREGGSLMLGVRGKGLTGTRGRRKSGEVMEVSNNSRRECLDEGVEEVSRSCFPFCVCVN